MAKTLQEAAQAIADHVSTGPFNRGQSVTETIENLREPGYSSTSVDCDLLADLIEALDATPIVD